MFLGPVLAFMQILEDIKHSCLNDDHIYVFDTTMSLDLICYGVIACPLSAFLDISIACGSPLLHYLTMLR